MSANFGSGGGGGRGRDNQDVELNLASIIDCFTVLITFMLASASFLSIGLLDAGVAAAGATASDSKPPSVNIVVELSKAQKFTVKVSGRLDTTMTVPAKGGTWDYETLTRNLGGLKAKFSDANAVTLIAANDVEYKDVIKAMEVTRKTMPAVLLGGF